MENRVFFLRTITFCYFSYKYGGNEGMMGNEMAERKKTPHGLPYEVVSVRSCFPALFYGVGKHGKVSCSLDRNGKLSLMLCAVAGDPSGKDLTSLRDILL